MPGLFNLLRISGPYASSKTNRDTTRSNIIIEAGGTTLEHAIDPVVLIPTKLVQILLGSYALFHQDTHYSEKLLHLLQIAVAATQFALAIELFFTHGLPERACPSVEPIDCKLAFFFQLIYAALILPIGVVNEYSKDPYTTPETDASEAASAQQTV